jgi:hypothetical protein
VYFTASGRIAKCSVNGCGNNPTTIASFALGSGTAWGVSVDQTNVYWAMTYVPCPTGTGTCGVVAQCPK